MSLAASPHSPLSLLLRFLGRPIRVSRSGWCDSQPDSIGHPSEAPPRETGIPEWMGYTPDIQRLLR